MISLVNGLSRVILKVTSRNRRAPDPLPEWAYMDTSSVNLSGTADNSPQAYLLGAFLFFYLKKRTT